VIACDVFLTTDYASIWTHRRALKRVYGINAGRPAEVYEELALPRHVRKIEKRQIIHVDMDAFFSGRPGGCTVVPPGQEEGFLAPLPVDRLWGVGARTKARLESMGVRTIGELARALPERLVLEFGQRGLTVYRCSRGIDETLVTPRRPLKSVSWEHTFERELDDPRVVEDSLGSLAESLALRLHQLGMKGRTVTVKLRYSDCSTFTCSRSRALDLET